MKYSVFPLILSCLVIAGKGQTSSKAIPKLLNSPKAEKPKEARKTGLGGYVSVLVNIDENGTVLSATDAQGPDWICPGVTHPDVLALRQAAINAALTAKFEPRIVEGRAVPSSTRLIVNFTADKKKAGISTIGHRSPHDVVDKSASSIIKPNYPTAARAAKASGPVNIQVMIEVDGTVFSAEPTSGHPLLLTAARNAACQARFSPTILSGQPVRVTGSITYNFKLDSPNDKK